MSFRKFFKIQVLKPLDVKTKFYNAENDDVYLEAQVQNITAGPICLEKVALDASHLFNGNCTHLTTNRSSFHWSSHIFEYDSIWRKRLWQDDASAPAGRLPVSVLLDSKCEAVCRSQVAEWGHQHRQVRHRLAVKRGRKGQIADQSAPENGISKTFKRPRVKKVYL